MDDELQPEDIQALLRTVEADTTTTSASTAQIRRSVLAAFDEAAALAESPGQERAPLITLDGGLGRPISPRRVVAWAAAAAVVLLGLAMVARGPWQLDTVGPADREAPGGRRLAVTGPEGSAVLTPGPQATDVIAGGLTFDAPAGLLVIEETEGRLVLAAADGSDSSGRFVIMETMLIDWEAALADLAEAGEVNIKEVGVIVGGQAATRLDVTVASSAVAERSCSNGQPCIHLDGWPSDGPGALWAGADNRIVELGRSDDSLVLAIDVSQRFTGPLSRSAAQIINGAILDIE